MRGRAHFPPNSGRTASPGVVQNCLVWPQRLAPDLICMHLTDDLKGPVVADDDWTKISARRATAIDQLLVALDRDGSGVFEAWPSVSCDHLQKPAVLQTSEQHPHRPFDSRDFGVVRSLQLLEKGAGIRQYLVVVRT